MSSYDYFHRHEDSYRDLDPLDYGKTSVRYEPVSREENAQLAAVFSQWQPEARNARFSRLCMPERKSNNFIVEAGTNRYMLKKGRIDYAEAQDLANWCVGYCSDRGVRVSRPAAAQNGSTLYISGDDTFRLYDFIEGKDFDSSVTELVNAAGEMGTLHRVLEEMPAGELVDMKMVTIQHDRKLLQEITETIRARGRKTVFDAYVIDILDELDICSESISKTKINELPSHAIHHEFHPHNVLFDGTTKELLAVLDFDSIRYSQRARDIGFGMHRFSRMCGRKTESDHDAVIMKRARAFLSAYNNINQMTDEEYRALPLLIQDEALRRIIIILGKHYIRANSAWSFDLTKHVATLREADIFSTI